MKIKSCLQVNSLVWKTNREEREQKRNDPKKRKIGLIKEWKIKIEIKQCKKGKNKKIMA